VLIGGDRFRMQITEPRTPHNTTVGRRGEAIAADWLVRHGYRILDRNWRCSRGEVDIVARHDDALVFVEVKARSGTATGHPFEAITRRKAARMRRVAAAWCTAHPDEHAPAIRVDAVAVHVDPLHELHGVEHLADVS
jgi:putative endonuclease